jgi:aryl-alcohol dehydrogenase-like predicted oxidoreductase
MNRLALGTVQFGLPYGIANQAGQVTRVAAKEMLELARSQRIDTLDTAIAYGDSEVCLGEIGTQGFKVVTKLPAVPEQCSDVSDWVCQQMAASLSRLGVSEVDGLLLHRPSQLLGSDGETLFRTMSELKEAGTIKKIGVSIYSPVELDALIPRYRFDLVQAPFSLVDRRLFDSGWLHRLKQEGVEIHTRSAFLQGLLLMPHMSIPAKFAPWAQQWDTWHRWLSTNAVTAAQACLAYPLSFSEVDRVVIGADSVAQLGQTIEEASRGFLGVLPDISCEDENLINPANWSRL